VTLPQTVNDNLGNQWVIYPQGLLRQQGNMPLFGQAATLIVNGNQPNSTNNVNQARLDEKTGEYILENMNAGGIMVTRRILVNKQLGYLRYIDVLKNPTQQEMSAPPPPLQFIDSCQPECVGADTESARIRAISSRFLLFTPL